MQSKRQGDKGAGGLAIGVALLMIIVLPLCLVFRLVGRIGIECPSCHKKTSKQFAPCRRCGSILSQSVSDEVPGGQPPEVQVEGGTKPLEIRAESSLSSPLTKFCRECGAKIPRTSRFCRVCGTKLA